MKCKVIIGSLEGLASVENLFNKWISDNPKVVIDTIQQLRVEDPKKIALLVLYEAPVEVKVPKISSDKLPSCPDCGRAMVVRANKKKGTLFLGCGSFPECRGLRPFSSEDYENLYGPDPGPSNEDDIPF